MLTGVSPSPSYLHSWCRVTWFSEHFRRRPVANPSYVRVGRPARGPAGAAGPAVVAGAGVEADEDEEFGGLPGLAPGAAALHTVDSRGNRLAGDQGAVAGIGATKASWRGEDVLGLVVRGIAMLGQRSDVWIVAADFVDAQFRRPGAPFRRQPEGRQGDACGAGLDAGLEMTKSLGEISAIPEALRP